MRIWLPILALLCLCAVAVANPPISIDDAGIVTPAPGTPAADPAGTVRSIVEAIGNGHWRLAVAGALALLMVAGVRWGAGLFGTTDRGKAIAVMVLALLGVFSATLATSAPLTWGVIWGALGVAFTAVGARQWLSRMLWPADGAKPVAEWLRPWLGR